VARAAAAVELGFVKRRLWLVLGLAAACAVVGGSATASPPVAPGPPATAEGLAIQVVAADQTVAAATTEGSAPPDAGVPEAPFAYPADGSVVSAASTAVSATASAADGTAGVTTSITRLSLFLGEITADAVQGAVSSAGTIGDVADSQISNLVVLGAPVTVAANARIPLADWGYALLLTESTKKGAAGSPSWRGTVTALVVHLDVDHGGLPAGSEIRIGYADAYARPPQSATTTTGPTATAPVRAPAPTRRARPHMPPPTVTPSGAAGTKKAKSKKRKPGAPLVLQPPTVTPKLTAGGYVFPVYGPSGYGDTFGAPRGDVSGGWHHGDDIFAPLGAPILAVASGTVFSVGWNDVGGWRLWLRDQGGNEFYYAHLSAYTALAVEGRHVNAGDVLGFVGNTGDAQGTPFHLHFEVHPVSMLFLGYDGAVNPTRYLDAWKRLADVRILPAVPFAAIEASAAASTAPTPGAILLVSSDISTASGLDPGSLRRAMRAPVALTPGSSSIGELPTPLPTLDRA
jgi:murein DD-endopeptidase MepM/ murein hydrolase activator NlpD